MSQPPRPSYGTSGGLGRRIAIGVAVAAVALLVVGMWANALAEPVVRAGVPTGSVTPPAPKPKPSKSAAPSASTKPSESAKPSAKPTPKPTKPASEFTTSTATQGSVSGIGKQHTFVVKVQTSTKLDANAVAKQVAGVLNDPRSWSGDGSVQFALVKDPKKADFTVYLSAPQIADADCAKTARVCVRGSKLVLSAAGWGTPPATYAGDPTGFRRYLVNHAVGSYLGEDAASCKKAGRPAPVMAPQGDDLKGCTPNPWPHG